MDKEAQVALLKEAEKALQQIPQQLRAKPGDLSRVRGRWERLRAELRYLLLEEDEDLHRMALGFMAPESDESPLRFLRLLDETGDHVGLGAMGRMVLDSPDCPDREAIQALVDKLSKAPKRWDKRIDRFVANPSVEAWDALMQFCPEDVRYQRVKNTLRSLLSRGVDPNLVFILGTKDGLYPDAIGWAENGLVEPETILAQEKTMFSNEMRGTFMGMAAFAYFHRGDWFNTVRCLREAVALSDMAVYSVQRISQQANPVLREMMQRAGLPLCERAGSG